MHRILIRCRSLVVAALFVLLLLPALALADGEVTRSCSVKEVVKGGIYVYLRCEEKGADIWLATVARSYKVDEVISFVDAPPMTNFYSKHLDRTFSEVIFTDILPPGEKRN